MAQPLTTILADMDLLNDIQRMQGIKLDDSPNFTVVDSDSALSEMIDSLVGLPVKPPSIYVDLEGIKLSRQGTISILQLYVHPKDHTYLIDVHQLQAKAFCATGESSGMTLKAILEADDIPKVFFDVRNDSDALFYHFQISLSGVQDIQLMELATRNYPKRHVSGLKKCIERDALMTTREKVTWSASKEIGMKLFSPERGGRYEVFNDRPLAEELIQYCVQDVQFLPRLWSQYNGKVSAKWAVKVQKATEDRVLSSQSKGYEGHSAKKAEAPEGWCSKKGASQREGHGVRLCDLFRER